MLRRTCNRFRAIPFSELFSYSNVLTSVFTSPGQRPCISVEVPGQPHQRYTYGDVQRDVVALADTIAAHVRTASSDHTTEGQHRPLGIQLPRSANVKGVFHADKNWTTASKSVKAATRAYSHDALHDDGSYNAAILCSPSYEYVISMLAVWSLGLMAVPMAPQHHYDGEMTHILGHSASRLLIVERSILKSKLPTSYESLVMGHHDKNHEPVKEATTTVPTTDTTFSVDGVLDISGWILQHRQRLGGATKGTDGHEELRVEEIVPPAPEPDQQLRPFLSGAAAETAEEALARMRAYADKEQRAEEDALEGRVFDELRRTLNRSAGEVLVPPLTFDDTRLEKELNPVFLGRFRALKQQPSAGDVVDDAKFLINQHNDSLMIYTSGTTAKPKGVVHTHASVDNQVKVLRDAWRWTSDDTILNTLPLHHVHGVVNILLCALSSGAHCIMSPFDNATRIAQRLDHGDISLFMGVPTMYTKLIDAVGNFSPIEQTAWRGAVSQNVRLMVSGSAALPVPVLERFRAISGHTLLERYGMTEVGMALSQPYAVKGRIPGTVGAPLPGVETLLVQAPAANDAPAAKDVKPSTSGALALRSQSLFDRYWNHPAATMGELVVDETTGLHYFASGDTVGLVPAVAVGGRGGEGGEATSHFQILGRTSVDIIKHKGYKLSALEIETALLQEPNAFTEVAVFGVAREDVGEEVVAVVALHAALQGQLGNHTTTDDAQLVFCLNDVNDRLRKIGRHHLAHYKAPSRYIVVEKIPRNAMGKVNKKDLKKRIASSA